MFLKKSNKQQSGRSMVEMLGVLAIIGVLSIGGIAGYTLSMRRYRANQVVDAVNKYALIVYGACQKSMIDGDIETMTACRDVPSFGEVGLVLSDATYIKFLNITQQSGIDVVTIQSGYNYYPICDAVKSAIGSKKSSDCRRPEAPIVDISIKMN